MIKKISIGVAAIVVYLSLGHSACAVFERVHYGETCGCGDTQACTFGPGIVGVQTCNYHGRWRACEPDPAYRVRP